MQKSETLTVYMNGKQILVDAEVEYFTQKDRMLKAAQALGICWGVAVVTAFVPVIHFVISPIALVAGPIAAAFVYLKVKSLPKRLEGQLNCVNCQASTRFGFVNAKPPLFDACTSCKTGFEVLWPPKR